MKMEFAIISAVVACAIGIVLGVIFAPKQSESNVAIKKLENGDNSCTKAFENLKLVNSAGDK